ncbi:MAG TPA: histidine kinase, partial [Gallionella sp.]|nr:histidine kinase [Gallionella sp.]
MYVKSAHQVKQRRPALAHMLAALKSHSFGFVSHGEPGKPLQLSAQLLEIQEGERRRIATDLHDVIGQSLTMIKLAVEESE